MSIPTFDIILVISNFLSNSIFCPRYLNLKPPNSAKEEPTYKDSCVIPKEAFFMDEKLVAWVEEVFLP